MESSHTPPGGSQQRQEPNRYRVDLSILLPDGPDIARGVVIGAIAYGHGITIGGAVALGAMAAVPGRRTWH